MAGLSPLIGPSPSPSPSSTIEPDAVPRSRTNAPTPTSAPDRIETSTAQSPIDQLRRHAESVVSGTENAAASAAASTIHAVQSAVNATGDAAKSVAHIMNDGLKSAASAARSMASGAASGLNEAGHVAGIAAKDLNPNPVFTIIKIATEPLPAGEDANWHSGKQTVAPSSTTNLGSQVVGPTVSAPKPDVALSDAAKKAKIDIPRQGESNGSAESKTVINQVTALKATMPPARQARVTVAAAVARDQNGNEHVMVSSSEPNGRIRPSSYTAVSPGATVSEGRSDGKVQHAEMNIIDDAKRRGWSIVDVGASNGICVPCQNDLAGTGAHYSTRLREDKN